MVDIGGGSESQLPDFEQQVLCQYLESVRNWLPGRQFLAQYDSCVKAFYETHRYAFINAETLFRNFLDSSDRLHTRILQDITDRENIKISHYMWPFMNIMTTVFFICAYIQMENSIRYQAVGFLKESIIFAVMTLLSSIGARQWIPSETRHLNLISSMK